MRKPLLTALTAVLAVVASSVCVEARSAGTDASRPVFNLLRFFDGTSYSKGTITTLLVSTEAFSAKFDGRLNGRRLRLDEHFTFEDGKRLQHWELAETSPGRITGTVTTELKTGRPAPTVPVSGTMTAGGATLDYDGYAPGGGDTVLHFHHAMTPRVDGTVANHVTVSKDYLPLATSDVTFAKSRAALARH